MTPTDNSVISFDGDTAYLTDGVVTHEFELVSVSQGAGPGLACALIVGASGAWDIEITTGRVIDIADAAMPDVSQLMPAGTEGMV